jgi:hypothetical protein
MKERIYLRTVLGDKEEVSSKEWLVQKTTNKDVLKLTRGNSESIVNTENSKTSLSADKTSISFDRLLAAGEFFNTQYEWFLEHDTSPNKDQYKQGANITDMTDINAVFDPIMNNLDINGYEFKETGNKDGRNGDNIYLVNDDHGIYLVTIDKDDSDGCIERYYKFTYLEMYDNAPYITELIVEYKKTYCIMYGYLEKDYYQNSYHLVSIKRYHVFNNYSEIDSNK